MPVLVAKITATAESNDFKPVLFWLEGLGLSFKNPVSNTITGWNEAGEQFTINLDQVQRQLRNKESGSVQMWFDSGSDVFISWNVRELSIFLDGISLIDKRKVIQCVSNKFIDMQEGIYVGWKLCVGIEDVM